LRPRLLATPCLLTLALWVFGVPTATAATSNENFDTDTTLQPPTGPDYTFSSTSSNVFVSNVQSHTAPNSLRANAQVSGGTQRFTYTGLDFCTSGLSFTVWYFTAAYPPSGTSDDLDLGVAAGSGLYISVGDAGQITFVIASPQALSNIAVPLSTWVDFSFSAIDCTSNKATFSSNALQFSVTIDQAGDQLTTLNYFQYGMASVSPYTRVAYLDDLSISGLTAAATPTVGAAVTATVVGLTGFDVDPYDHVIISRNAAAGVSSVNTYDATTLAIRGASPVATGCNRQDGVMAYSIPSGATRGGREFSGYMACTSGAATTNQFSIRGGDLNNPDQSGTQCTDYCNINIASASTSISPYCTNQNAATFSSSSAQLGNVAPIPISWENSENPANNAPRRAYVGFAFDDTSNGNVGAWLITQLNNNHDLTCMATVPFSTPSESRQVCTWRNPHDNLDYLAASGANSPTRAWRLAVDTSAGGNLQLSQTSTLTAPLDKMVALSCAGNDATMMDGSGMVRRVHIVGTSGTGGLVWGPLTGYAATRGVAMSQDEKWGAYIATSTTANIVNGTTGAIVGTVTLPTGTFKGMRLDDTGQVLWIATDVRISKYNINAVTTVASQPPGSRGTGTTQTCVDANLQPKPCGGATAGGTTSTGAIGNFFGVDPGRLDPKGEGDSTRGGFLLSLMLIIGFAAVGASIIPSRSPSTMMMGAAIGGVLGFGWTVFLGVMPPVITFILVVLGILVSGIKFAGNKFTETA
jgi:hypothetical protein